MKDYDPITIPEADPKLPWYWNTWPWRVCITLRQFVPTYRYYYRLYSGPVDSWRSLHRLARRPRRLVHREAWAKTIEWAKISLEP